jgi:hypothetical protein
MWFQRIQVAEKAQYACPAHTTINLGFAELFLMTLIWIRGILFYYYFLYLRISDNTGDSNLWRICTLHCSRQKSYNTVSILENFRDVIYSTWMDFDVSGPSITSQWGVLKRELKSE